jgi:hypothetical protein
LGDSRELKPNLRKLDQRLHYRGEIGRVLLSAHPMSYQTVAIDEYVVGKPTLAKGP